MQTASCRILMYVIYSIVLCLIVISPSDTKDKKTRHHHLTQTNPNEVTHAYGARWARCHILNICISYLNLFRYGTSSIPKYHLASKVCCVMFCPSVKNISTSSQGIASDAAYQLIHDELALGMLQCFQCSLVVLSANVSY
jgi:hypothetical protein